MTIPKELVWLALVPPLIAFWMLFRRNGTVVKTAPNYRRGLAMCLLMNGCGCFFAGANYAALLLAPILSFSIAVAVARTVGRYSFFVGVAGCPWFLVPAIVYTRNTYTTDQVVAYGMPPFDRFTGFVLAFGVTGALVAQIAELLKDRRVDRLDLLGNQDRAGNVTAGFKAAEPFKTLAPDPEKERDMAKCINSDKNPPTQP